MSPPNSPGLTQRPRLVNLRPVNQRNCRGEDWACFTCDSLLFTGTGSCSRKEHRAQEARERHEEATAPSSHQEGHTSSYVVSGVQSPDLHPGDAKAGTVTSGAPADFLPLTPAPRPHSRFPRPLPSDPPVPSPRPSICHGGTELRHMGWSWLV